MELGRSAAKMQPGMGVTFEDVAKIELAEVVHFLGEERGGGRSEREGDCKGERQRASERARESARARASERDSERARARERERARA
jgi:hypothetical protein